MIPIMLAVKVGSAIMAGAAFAGPATDSPGPWTPSTVHDATTWTGCGWPESTLRRMHPELPSRREHQPWHERRPRAPFPAIDDPAAEWAARAGTWRTGPRTQPDGARGWSNVSLGCGSGILRPETTAALPRRRDAEANEASLTSPRETHRERRTSGEVAIKAAESWLGTPYTWGGGTSIGPSRGIGRGAGRVGFDCSGLAMAAWAKAGVSLGHYTGTQFRQGRRVSVEALRPGDLMFFGGHMGRPAHVGLYAGGGMMIHAPKTGDVVKQVDVLHSGYYMRIFRGAVRPADVLRER